MIGSFDFDRKEALEFHKKAKGKVQTIPTVNIRNEHQLGIAYVPGCVIACDEIKHNPSLVYEYTGKANRIAEVSNGHEVLGMGDVGPEASIPMLEGKALLLKLFGDVNAIPMAINAPTADEIINFCRMIAPTVGAINIEDIGSPDTFHVVRRLTETLDIPVFCDDQQGSAVIILSAVKNSIRLLDISLPESRIVVMGAGAAGIASTDLLLKAGAHDIIILDEGGILGPSHPGMDNVQAGIAEKTNPRGVRGGLDEAIAGADILVGLSRGNTVSKGHIKKMNKKPVVLALALSNPEISHVDAVNAGAFIYASGNVHDDNAMLNIHAFPGIVRGALDVRAKKLTDSMLLAASDALANMIDRRNLTPDHICPKFFGSETTPRVAEAVGQAAISDGVAFLTIPEGRIYQDTWHRLFGDIEHI
ncbi:MAG: NAD-dependent malic enzyme [Synergistaceae bacterium]|jgi:malate dehydrogenase (oxaloacetate-decarboxylating)|nr:NAD-dependent malic enzyme [Synergistaceae bacterium]